MKRLNIVLPVLNEEAVLESSIEKIERFLQNEKIPYLLTIADNDSTDSTAQIAQKLCLKSPFVEYLKISQIGVGLAFREAILHNAKRKESTNHKDMFCEFIGYMDIDLSTDIMHLSEVYERLMDGESIVVGSRLLKDSQVSGRSLKRTFTSRVLNIIMRLVLSARFNDCMCGFKFYQAPIAQRLVENCYKDNGWFYCAQMLIVAQYSNIAITQIPINWEDDSNSKVKIMRLSCEYLKQISRLFVRRIRGKLACKS
ncbi:glycosyltransferase [Helicobacter sp. MIT 00-7814]|uniref:glycosyltransferase n=1 Tax=unclassified Helicobacter TaxID=2593540 RepID=UPI000E1E6355|nr:MULTISPECIES: glycosyltransferase [unclassified Helicobacter]RDU53435.1 glycosyltransferase [Helicobacter sp. MIT 99-10781]RDU53734.1 glycosyltransferase [Helicobacter sp. MIT 00-7814]